MEKYLSFATQISTRSCRSIRFTASVRRQRVDGSLYRSFSLCISGEAETGSAREKHGPLDSCHEHRSSSLSLSFSPDFSYFEHFPTRRGSTWWLDVALRGIDDRKIEKSGSLNVIVNRDTGFHSRVSTSGYNRYFGLWRAWPMAVCCKIENVVSQVRSGIFNFEMFGWKRLRLFDLTSMLREKVVESWIK